MSNKSKNPVSRFLVEKPDFRFSTLRLKNRVFLPENPVSRSKNSVNWVYRRKTGFLAKNWVFNQETGFFNQKSGFLDENSVF